MSIHDRVVPPPPVSQVEQALVREQRSQGFVLAHLGASISAGLLHDSGEHLSELPQPSSDTSTVRKRTQLMLNFCCNNIDDPWY